MSDQLEAFLYGALAGALIAAAVAWYLASVFYKAMYLGMMAKLAVKPKDQQIARICRTCEPDSPLQAGDHAWPCPHGGVVSYRVDAEGKRRPTPRALRAKR